MAWYRTGTISLSNNSTAVTGVGTAWIANAAVGEALYAPDGKLYEIVAIVSDTVLTLGSAYLGTNTSGQSYVIVPSQSYIRDLAAQAAALVNNYSTIYNTVGQGKFQDGTLAAPGIAFNQDQDTGFYRSAANEVTFVANGVAQFKYGTGGVTFLNGINATSLTLSGNTTIGDASGDTLTVNATPTLAVNPTLSAGSANGVLYLNGSKVATTGSALTFDGTNLGVGGVPSVIFHTKQAGSTYHAIERTTAGSEGILYVGATSSSNQIVSQGASSAAKDLTFQIGATEQMRLTSTGLGIGTSSPAEKLDVFGQGQFRPITNTTGNSDWFVIGSIQEASNFGVGVGLVVENSGSNVYGMTFGTRPAGSSITERMRLNSSGNLGLGVTPSAWSSLYKAIQFPYASIANTGTGNIPLSLSQNAYFNGTSWIAGITSTSKRYEISDIGHVWFNGASATAGNAISFTQAMTLDASGNLGIGITNPSTKLHAQAANPANGYVATISNSQGSAGRTGTYLLFDATSLADWKIGIAPDVNAFSFYDVVAGSERMRIDSSGNVGIGRPAVVGALEIVSSAYAAIVPKSPIAGVGQTVDVLKVTDRDVSNFANARYSAIAHIWNVNGATEGMRIDSSGNVGIGTSSPATKMQVSGGSVTELRITSSGSIATGSAAIVRFGGSNSQTSGYVGYGGSANSYDMWNTLAGPMAFGTNNTERMRIDSAGNVGVGTSSPSAKFVVSNAGSQGIEFGYSASLSANFLQSINRTNGADVDMAYYLASSTGSHKFYTTATERMRIDSSGNVGIGTSSPNAKLTLSGTNTSIRINDNAQSWFWITAQNSANMLSIGGTGATVPASGALNIDSSGNLLVGESSNTSGSRMEVLANASSTTSGAITGRASNASFTGAVYIAYADRNTTNGSFTVFNYYNIGAAQSKFVVYDSGNCVNTNGSYGAISDVKLKENIVDATPKLDDLCKVKVRNYNLKSDQTHKQIGVIAQELEEVFPGLVEEMVDKDKDGNDLETTTKQVKYSVFVPMLIKAIQELKAELDATKAEVAALKGV